MHRARVRAVSACALGVSDESGRRDSNPRHSAWESRYPCFAVTRNAVLSLLTRFEDSGGVPFVPPAPPYFRTSVRKLGAPCHRQARASTPPASGPRPLSRVGTAQGGSTKTRARARARIRERRDRRGSSSESRFDGPTTRCPGGRGYPLGVPGGCECSAPLRSCRSCLLRCSTSAGSSGVAVGCCSWRRARGFCSPRSRSGGEVPRSNRSATRGAARAARAVPIRLLLALLLGARERGRCCSF